MYMYMFKLLLKGIIIKLLSHLDSLFFCQSWFQLSNTFGGSGGAWGEERSNLETPSPAGCLYFYCYYYICLYTVTWLNKIFINHFCYSSKLKIGVNYWNLNLIIMYFGYSSWHICNISNNICKYNLRQCWFLFHFIFKGPLQLGVPGPRLQQMMNSEKLNASSAGESSGLNASIRERLRSKVRGRQVYFELK